MQGFFIQATMTLTRLRMRRLIWVFIRCSCHIMKTYLYKFDPLKPHFYIVKLGFTGYTVFFLFLLKNIDCGYSIEPPRRGGSNEYPQFMFWAEIWKISEFLSENYQFLVVKFSIYLNRGVFVMRSYVFWSVANFFFIAVIIKFSAHQYAQLQLPCMILSRTRVMEKMKRGSGKTSGRGIIVQ